VGITTQYAFGIQSMNITKTPFVYQATIGIVIAFLIYLLLFYFNYIDFDVSDLLIFYSFSVYTVSLAAVLGGILMGMFIATRALSNQGFTPFEVSMLKLRDDVHNLQKELKSISKSLENRKNGKENSK
jgi:uncharacterized integral membrane protein